MSTFPKARHAILWDPAERMASVFGAADRLATLPSGPERAQVEASLRVISTGTAIA